MLGKQAGKAFGHGQPQRPGLAGCGALIDGDLVGRFLHPLGGFHKAAAGGGRFVSARVALEQPGVQRLFKTVDPSRHGDVRRAQQPRGPRQLSFARDGKEELEIIPAKRHCSNLFIT